MSIWMWINAFPLHPSNRRLMSLLQYGKWKCRKEWERKPINIKDFTHTSMNFLFSWCLHPFFVKKPTCNPNFLLQHLSSFHSLIFHSIKCINAYTATNTRILLFHVEVSSIKIFFFFLYIIIFSHVWNKIFCCISIWEIYRTWEKRKRVKKREKDIEGM